MTSKSLVLLTARIKYGVLNPLQANSARLREKLRQCDESKLLQKLARVTPSASG